MTPAAAPIGIFDSGVGGLSVLRHIHALLPNESLCYFADSGFAPYGDKSEDEVKERTLLATQHLLELGVKALVVACNTATAAAISLIRERYPELILVGVEPGLKPAASLTKTGYIGVLATRRTLASRKYQQLCNEIEQTMQVRFVNQACPGLADHIERGELESGATLGLLEKYLQPILNTQADTLVLGCTHYPFIENSIRSLVSKVSHRSISMVDTGQAIAKQLRNLLEKRQLLNFSQERATTQFITSGDVAQLKAMLSLIPSETIS